MVRFRQLFAAGGRTQFELVANNQLASPNTPDMEERAIAFSGTC
jgi:hypothetical protein